MLEVLLDGSNDEEVHRHVALVGLSLELLMESLGQAHRCSDSLLRIRSTRHEPTVASARGPVVDGAVTCAGGRALLTSVITCDRCARLR